MFCTFKFSFDVNILSLFGNCFGYFLKIGHFFNLLVTLLSKPRNNDGTKKVLKTPAPGFPLSQSTQSEILKEKLF
jgi:hypothetical protein